MKKTCKCGNNINDPKIDHKSEYSKWGWFLLTILGMSAKPKSVKFICRDCNETILISKSNDILNKYVGR